MQGSSAAGTRTSREWAPPRIQSMQTSSGTYDAKDLRQSNQEISGWGAAHAWARAGDIPWSGDRSFRPIGRRITSVFYKVSSGPLETGTVIFFAGRRKHKYNDTNVHSCMRDGASYLYHRSTETLVILSRLLPRQTLNKISCMNCPCRPRPIRSQTWSTWFIWIW
jgi:hypothetical protein